MLKIKYFSLLSGILFSGTFILAQVPQFNQDRAFSILEIQCQFGPRNPGSQGHEDCLNYLVDELSKCTEHVHKQTFQQTLSRHPQAVKSTNIIAQFGKQSQRILLCAHWDTRPWADSDPDPEHHKTPILGANDGASGVAVLLEIAHLLSQYPASVGIDIVLFDVEDAGVHENFDSWCLGSAYFAHSGWLENYPQYAILLDMIGDKDLSIPVECYSRQYTPEIVDKIWSRAEELGLEVFKKEEGPSVYDDHLNLLKMGIPTVDIIDFNYPFWHTMEDIPENCSAESLGIIGRLVVSLVYSP